MQRRARIGLIAACCLVGCEAVGTIGLASHDESSTSSDTSSTSDAIEDVHVGSSSDGDSSEGASTDDHADDAMPPMTGPASGGGTDTSTTGDEAPGTLSADLGTDETGTESEGGGEDGGCCAAQDGPGCGDVLVESCVCELDPYCCDEAWDEACVNTAKLSACAPGCADPELAQLDCCSESEAAGCTEPEVQECVCSVDPYCCAHHWDAACVDHVDELGCGMCSMI